jgi:hypothetical protein
MKRSRDARTGAAIRLGAGLCNFPMTLATNP